MKFTFIHKALLFSVLLAIVGWGVSEWIPPRLSATTPDPTAIGDEHDHEHAEEGEEAHADPTAHEDDFDHEQVPQHAEESADVDAHAGHDHAEAEGHTESLIALTPAQRERVGLRIAVAAGGELTSEINLLGEVQMNEDTLVHLVPRTPGIAESVVVEVGDRVSQGQVLAVMDSLELGEAKAAYFEVYNEVGCCTIDLDRARIIAENTANLLADLKAEPALEELRGREYGDMGRYRTLLFSAYADFWVARNGLQRREKLFADKITTENDYWEAVGGFEKAKAEFLTAQDTAAFESSLEVIELERQLRTNQFRLRMAEQQLLLLGIDPHRLETVRSFNGGQASHEEVCTDPNCEDCAEHSGDAAHAEGEHAEGEHVPFSRVQILAPIAGTVVQRHITRGEWVSPESEILTIADLSTVWVDFQVPVRDLGRLRPGQTVEIANGHDGQAQGVVHLVAPVLEGEGRTGTVRVVLDNPAGAWRPGMFVTGRLLHSEQGGAVLVPVTAIQQLDGQDVIFIPEGEEFIPQPVVLGRRTRAAVEVLTGLEPGAAYVEAGGFALKAMLVTNNLGSHAGHGH